MGVSLIGDRLVRHGLASTGGSFDGLTDRVERSGGISSRLEDRAESRIGLGIRSAVTCRDFDLANQLGEELRALGVRCSLFAFDRRPFGMSGHVLLTGCTRRRMLES